MRASLTGRRIAVLARRRGRDVGAIALGTIAATSRRPCDHPLTYGTADATQESSYRRRATMRIVLPQEGNDASDDL